MFTSYHFIWLAICAAACAALIYALKKYRPSLRKLLSWASIGCVISEVIKVFSVLEMIPSADGSTMHLYMQTQHLPLHLCSIQILFIFYTGMAKDSRARDMLLAFMYPTCTMGAVLAMLMPSIFSTTIEVSQAFTHPQAYQFFLYHVMLFVLGVYIPMSKEVPITWKHYGSSMGILGALGLLSIYFNSMFAVPIYENGELVAVDYSTNFFFTQRTPIGIELLEKWHWYLYLGIIALIAVVSIGVFFLPYRIKEKKAAVK